MFAVDQIFEELYCSYHNDIAQIKMCDKPHQNMTIFYGRYTHRVVIGLPCCA